MAESSRAGRARRRRNRRRRATALGLGVVVVAGGGVAAVAATNTSGPDLQLVTATTGSVTQTVESSGTITASDTSTPSFPVAGTVKSVAVKVGDSVTKGQALATLDTTSLQNAVDSANSTLASAQQRLEADETGQTTTGSADNASGGSATTGTGVTPAAYTTTDQPSAAGFQVDTDSATIVETAAVTTTKAATGSSLTDLIKQIESAQTAVVTAQKNIDSAQSAVDAAQKVLDTDIQQNTQLSDTEQTACATSSPPPVSDSPSGSPSDSPSATSTSDDCASAMADYEASATTLASDMAILDSKITTQDTDVSALDAATTELNSLIGQLQSAASAGNTGSTGSGGGSSGTGTGGSSGTGATQPDKPTGSGQSSAPGGSSGGAAQPGSAAGGSGPTTSQPASASQLAADQAAIDAAEAQLTLAKQNLAAATLTSPVAGRVASIGFTVGTDSSGQSLTIIGTGTEQVATTVPLAEIGLVKPGQPVSIKADGTTATLRGTVSSLSLLSTTTGSSTSFPVVLTLAVDSPHLPVGTGADAVITTATATDVTTVPNSAIHTSAAGQRTVTVYKNGQATVDAVTLGAIGNDTSQIKSGLAAGEQVELADPSQPLPSSTSSSATTGFTGFGGARGAGGAGGAAGAAGRPGG